MDEQVVVHDARTPAPAGRDGTPAPPRRHRTPAPPQRKRTTLVAVKPFLFIATRSEDEPAQTEYEAFRDLSGLTDQQLIRIRLERDPMPLIDPTSISGVIVGGSPFNASDPEEGKSVDQLRAEGEMRALLDMVIEHDLAFFGACYGVGSLGVHQGAVIDRTYGELAGAIPVTLTEEGKNDPLIQRSGVGDSFLALVGHKEAVRSLPAHAATLATGENCPVQMFRIGTKQYATQFHPELDADGLAVRAGFYRDHGYFAPDDYEDLVQSLRGVQADQSQAMLRAFVELFSQPADQPSDAPTA